MYLKRWYLICNTEFTSKSNLNKHLNNNKCKKINCKVLYDHLEESQKEQIPIKEPIIEEIDWRQIEPVQEDQNEIVLLEIEKERTKQKDIELKQKEEETKQKQLDFEMKKLEFEMMKLQMNV